MLFDKGFIVLDLALWSHVCFKLLEKYDLGARTLIDGFQDCDDRFQFGQQFLSAVAKRIDLRVLKIVFEESDPIDIEEIFNVIGDDGKVSRLRGRVRRREGNQSK